MNIFDNIEGNKLIDREIVIEQDIIYIIIGLLNISYAKINGTMKPGPVTLF